VRHSLTTLKIFVAVAECGNLTHAAASEHLAVSAISRRIAELEELAGTPLPSPTAPPTWASSPSGRRPVRRNRSPTIATAWPSAYRPGTRFRRWARPAGRRTSQTVHLMQTVD
jgi:hypothetical protein